MNHRKLRRHSCTTECAVVNLRSTEMFTKHYLNVTFKYVLPQNSTVQQYRPQRTDRGEFCQERGDYGCGLIYLMAIFIGNTKET